ncbi:single-stranded DNA-binding protein [Microbacterium sp. 179-I 3D3 NHS]|uniref:single-stranded DNA-binding protein n=1 Tax=unclassified Microbacterium TaxID=2609290 RepID=UPI0039A02C5C
MIDTVTIVGRVATDPTQGQTGGGVPVTNFRMASTHRRFDNTTQTWTDSGTNWFSVAAFRQLGEHAKASLRTGDSIIVTGRLRIRTWESNGRQGTSVDIEADAIGHDLRWGTTAYRPRRSTPADAAARPGVRDQDPESDAHGQGAQVQVDAEGQPASAEDEALPDLDLSWAEPAREPDAVHASVH